MKTRPSLPSRTPCVSRLRLLALAAALAVPPATPTSTRDVNQLVRAGKLTEALTKADQYLAAKPRDPQMRFIKGVIQTEAGKPTDAIATFTKLTEDYPELPEPYNNLAVLYAGQSQFDKARAALEMAIRTNPSYATAHENLGDVYAKLASQAYSKALQLDGGNAGVPAQAGPDPRPVQRRTPRASSRRPAPPAPPAPVTARTRTGCTSAPAPARPAAAAPATPAGRSTCRARRRHRRPRHRQPPVSAAEKEVEAAVRAWASAWAAKDMSRLSGRLRQGIRPTRQPVAQGLGRRAAQPHRRQVAHQREAAATCPSTSTATRPRPNSARTTAPTRSTCRAARRWIWSRPATAG